MLRTKLMLEDPSVPAAQKRGRVLHAVTPLRMRSTMSLLLFGTTTVHGFAMEQSAAALAVQYSTALAVNPLETKVVSACVFAVAGDAMAQAREANAYDARRAASFVAFDSVYRGAFQHYTFPLIADVCSGDALRTVVGTQMFGDNLLAAVECTAFNQMLVVPIVYYPLFFAITGAVQVRKRSQAALWSDHTC